MTVTPTTNPSNDYTFFPAYPEVVLEGFDRVGIRPSELTQQQLVSAYRSINFALSTWPNRSGPNLWTRDVQTVGLTSGQSTYNLPTNTIQLLDVYIRQYPMSGAESLSLDFTTTISSTSVSIGWTAHGLIVGNYINIVVPVSVGGLILSGFYTVTSVPNGNEITITATSAATSSDSPGTVPEFTAVGGSEDVTVTLSDHGYTAGSTFDVQVQTTVSDINLYGSYLIQSVTDSDNFVITASNNAYDSDSVFENSGLAFMAAQNNSADPIDRILYPLSETDYAAIPNKFEEGLPTSYFYNRLSPTPNVVLWLVPNNTGPYVLQYWRTRQIQDANLYRGQTPDVPYRFFEALCSDIAARLAQKFAPDKWPMLKQEAALQWKEAADADTEKVSIFMAPDFSRYYD